MLLDAASAPAATLVAAGLAVADPEHADDGRDEPADGGEEGEGDDGLPAAADGGAADGDVGPVKDGAAAAVLVVNEQAKGDEPEDGDEQVKGVVCEGAGEGEEPDKGEEDGDGGDDLCVDEAGEGPRVDAELVHVVQVAAVDAGDDGAEGQLRGAEDHAGDLHDGHGWGRVVEEGCGGVVAVMGDVAAVCVL